MLKQNAAPRWWNARPGASGAAPRGGRNGKRLLSLTANRSEIDPSRWKLLAFANVRLFISLCRERAMLTAQRRGVIG